MSSCTHCGMPINFGSFKTAVCKGCGRTNDLPKSTGECLKNLERANRLRRDREYAAALAWYDHVLSHEGEEHSALWGRILSIYGVEYLKDNDGKEHILVHFPQQKPFSEQSDFQTACSLAPESVRTQYEADAQYIDDVQRKHHALSQHCTPYEIFLCFKETVPNSTDRTVDYYLAQNLYQWLTPRYRVFFSPVTLKAAAGSNYEAAVYHALDTSRMMIVVGTQGAYMQSTWPQSEWHRFLTWTADKDTPPKRLIPMYMGMPREDLPKAFYQHALQDIDLAAPTALDALQKALDDVFGVRKPADDPTDDNMTPFQQTRYAAQQGDLEAQFRLGQMYDDGEGIPTDKTEAVSWYRMAADRGHLHAMNNLGFCYQNGTGVPQDREKGAHLYEQAAHQGFARAQYNLGVCYRDGLGVPQDDAQRFKWFSAAAHQGFAPAQNDLGICYANGKGTAIDKKAAAKWYLAAAEQGYAYGQNNLGDCYYSGNGVVQSYPEAVKWFRKGVEQGDPWCQSNLGICYENGQGLTTDKKEAFKFYKAAAEQGHVYGQYHLGRCYCYSIGTTENNQAAVKWFRAAADQKNPKATYQLGKCYYNGWGVAKDKVEAVRLYLAAAELGCTDATDALNKL